MRQDHQVGCGGDRSGTYQYRTGGDFLSTDNGQTFNTSLGTTANDGSHTVNFPSGIQSSNARLMIKAVDNIYYDVSDAKFELDSDRIVPPAPVSTSITATDGGAVIDFSPGEDNGVPISSFEAVCSAPDTSETLFCIDLTGSRF